MFFWTFKVEEEKEDDWQLPKDSNSEDDLLEDTQGAKNQSQSSIKGSEGGGRNNASNEKIDSDMNVAEQVLNVSMDVWIKWPCFEIQRSSY